MALITQEQMDAAVLELAEEIIGRIEKGLISPEIKVVLLQAEVERLLLENWQLKGALGYPVPSEIPEGPFKCGLCEARRQGLPELKNIE